MDEEFDTRLRIIFIWKLHECYINWMIVSNRVTVIKLLVLGCLKKFLSV